MKITLRVDVDGRYWSGGAVTMVDEMFQEAFEPIRASDVVWARLATGDIDPNSTTAERVLKLRKDASEILAQILAKMIVNEMKSNDTLNGYKVVDDEQ